MYISEQWNDKRAADYIRSKLIKYNASCLPDQIKSSVENLNLLLKDDAGKLFGGITGTIFWAHLHVDFLWVDQSMRGKGYGSKLLRMAERLAKEKQCRLILLDTFSFQAPEFYKRHGYIEYGVVEDHPAGYSQHFFEKRLMPFK
ncbi:GNAT family N-acetyltransferase [Sporolactobacillus pectinivorans]|uniref:GNAT family N-acetyltransferase n=1 Tax=Sporolactobacillus pectinivorans TaxID=1591408 RepID=UPI000C255D95|nr:GNAT family N-acetyltransferase [Sporolactobacillus pectinivorans]